MTSHWVTKVFYFPHSSVLPLKLQRPLANFLCKHWYLCQVSILYQSADQVSSPCGGSKSCWCGLGFGVYGLVVLWFFKLERGSYGTWHWVLFCSCWTHEHLEKFWCAGSEVSLLWGFWVVQLARHRSVFISLYELVCTVLILLLYTSPEKAIAFPWNNRNYKGNWSSSQMS